ncbi:hypothetical protein [Rhodopseudomonas palustris]|uniref:Uncharacterized protein n=1 Tax=Rhodopseudomonas palustris (strain BisB18) TaxID=316056 RepID=Q213F8_RHOPB
MLRRAFVIALALAGAAVLSADEAAARSGVPRGAFFGVYGPYYAGTFRYGSGPDFSDGDCYPLRQRVMTRAGWRIRRIEVCD